MTATGQLLARDAVIRQAAFDHVRGLQAHDPVLSHEVIRQGFWFEGERWPLINRQRGIFKPGTANLPTQPSPWTRPQHLIVWGRI